jgi:hypothetical protein
MMPERANRTFICSVLFLDIVEYSKKPVSEQIQLKDRFNSLIAEAIRDIVPNDRIILDTGDGVAVNFLGDPEDALFVAMSLREFFAPTPDEPPRLPARIGINLGPVRLVRDLNGQPNIIGDGINVAQRVMGFAAPGQIIVSRSFFEVVSHISEGYAKLFHYEGSRTDKHVREHEIYSVGFTNTRNARVRSPAERNKDSSQDSRRQAATATIATGTGTWLRGFEYWLNNRTIAYGAASLSVGAFALAIFLNFMKHEKSAASLAPLPPETETRRIADARPATRPVPSLPRPAERKPASARATTAGKNSVPVREVGQTEAGTDPVRPDHIEKKESKLSPFAFFGHQKPETETAVAPAVPVGQGLLSLAIAPWGEVFVDGDRVGVSPPVNEVEVTPGRRRVEIRNGNFPAYSQIIDVKADQKVRIKHKFN